MRSYTRYSIRSQLLCWLILPLGILSFATTAIAYYLAVGFANDAYDRELLNSADSVAARLRSNGKLVWADLPPAAQAVLRYKTKDKFYYQITQLDGRRISGDVLPEPLHNLQSRKPFFRYFDVNSEKLRAVRIRVDVPNYDQKTVLVQAAQTLSSRHQLTTQILLSIVIPQVILILLSALAVWIGVARGLLPLKSLELALGTRSRVDLTPVNEIEAPHEVLPLLKAINDLLARLRQDIELQQRFVANAAHQLRTPLAGLKTYIYAAKRLPSDMRMNAVLDQIDAGTDRMTRLANQLLSLARAEPNNRTSRFERIDLNLLISPVTANFVSKALHKNIDLSFSGSEAPAFVNASPSDITELTTNLIENAILYSQEGGQIIVGIDNLDKVILSVKDDGPGIPSDEQEKVFERFYRILGSEAPGSGLGLAIVKEIAVAHNADIALSCGPSGNGTLVKVLFPPALAQPTKTYSDNEILTK